MKIVKVAKCPRYRILKDGEDWKVGEVRECGTREAEWLVSLPFFEIDHISDSIDGDKAEE